MTNKPSKSNAASSSNVDISDLNIIMYSSEMCPTCQVVKLALGEHIAEGLLRVIDINMDEIVPEHRSQIKVVPTFFVNDELCKLRISAHGITINCPSYGDIDLIKFDESEESDE